ncbi:MAG TPA: TlpA disulfide reductase family protein [Candidatus Acidoferrales bacterium]|nr:TlpA disulfide reductase family protein [Candidatus Acidoferrales bacterium]
MACAPSAPAPLTQFTSEAEWIDLKGLQERLAAERGRVVVVNYWATWCEPCREEFPELIQFDREWSGRGVVFLSVSLDTASARDTEVKKFLAEQRPSFAVFIRRETDDPDTFINAIDPNWSGVLPATFIYDRQGQRRHSLFGPTTQARLETVVKPLL